MDKEMKIDCFLRTTHLLMVGLFFSFFLAFLIVRGRVIFKRVQQKALFKGDGISMIEAREFEETFLFLNRLSHRLRNNATIAWLLAMGIWLWRFL